MSSTTQYYGLQARGWNAYENGADYTTQDFNANMAAIDAALHALELEIQNAGTVKSVFGRTGVVVAQNGDYSASQITGLASVASTGAWSDLQNATGALTLNNGGNNTTFNHTSAITWTWGNITSALSNAAQSSPIISLGGQYWTGTVSAADAWRIQNVLTNGTNGASTLTFTHTGTSGTLGISLPTGTVISVPTNNITIQAGSNGNSGNIFLNASQIIFERNGTSGLGVAINSAAFVQLSTAINNIEFDIAGFMQTGITNPALVLVNGIAMSATSGTQVAVSLVSGGSNYTNQSFAPTSGTAKFIGVQVVPKINQTGSANGNYTALYVNPTETAVGASSGNMLLDLAVGGSRKWGIDTAGHEIAGSANNDGAGQLTLLAASTSISFSFAKAYGSAPVVVVSPTSNPGANYWVTSSTTGFTVNIASAPVGNVVFNYMVFGNPN